MSFLIPVGSRYSWDWSGPVFRHQGDTDLATDVRPAKHFRSGMCLSALFAGAVTLAACGSSDGGENLSSTDRTELNPPPPRSNSCGRPTPTMDPEFTVPVAERTGPMAIYTDPALKEGEVSGSPGQGPLVIIEGDRVEQIWKILRSDPRLGALIPDLKPELVQGNNLGSEGAPFGADVTLEFPKAISIPDGFGDIPSPEDEETPAPTSPDGRPKIIPEPADGWKNSKYVRVLVDVNRQSILTVIPNEAPGVLPCTEPGGN